eukprot:4045120-Pleurochrysis_carterae.AAC.1
MHFGLLLAICPCRRSMPCSRVFERLTIGRREMSDEQLELIQAVAAACRANGFFVKLICASAAEIRAQIALQ